MNVWSLIARVTVRACIVRSKEGADDELAPFHGPDRAAYLLDDAAVLVSHGRGLVHRANAAIAPQVRSADACSCEPDAGIRWLGDLWLGDFLKTDVPGSIKHGSSHG